MVCALDQLLEKASDFQLPNIVQYRSEYDSASKVTANGVYAQHLAYLKGTA